METAPGSWRISTDGTTANGSTLDVGPFASQAEAGTAIRQLVGGVDADALL